jgi:hypothetical protein
MKNLNIETGSVSLSINDDPERVITFNPSDVVFAERFYDMIAKFETKQIEYEARMKEIETVEGEDKYGIPLNMGEQLKLIHEVCDYFMAQIDYIFGEHTSEVVFGTNRTLNMFEQFFNGITPFVSEARNKAVSKYSAKGNGTLQ